MTAAFSFPVLCSCKLCAGGDGKVVVQHTHRVIVVVVVAVVRAKNDVHMRERQ